MPLTPVGLAGVLAPNLLATGSTGIAMPQFALGVATGVYLYCQAATLTSVDTGVLGVGSTALPMVVPQPLILSSMLAGFAATATSGIMAPSVALGLSNGLVLGFLQGILTLTHPSVGVGVGVTRVIPGGPGAGYIIAGFAAAALTGIAGVKLATAIGIALDIIFAAFTVPLPIVGAPSIYPGAGAGVGKIV
jgi:hypothetical protein